MRIMRWIAAAALVAGSTALAHEGGVDVRGAVVSADSGQVTVRRADGRETRFAITPDTHVFVGGRRAKPADLKPGARAVVHGRKSGTGLEASSVRCSMSKGAEPASPGK